MSTGGPNVLTSSSSSTSSRNTLVYLQELTKGINDNKGTVNCAHCALRLNEHIAAQQNSGSGPVPISSANLLTHPIFKKGKIKSSFTNDKRVEKHVASSKSKTSFLEIHDLTDDQASFYVDLTQTPETSNTHLHKIAKNLLIPTLQALPRRGSDNTAYGFIILTLKTKANIGHILNYFVDSNNTVYFIDAQVHTAARQITQQLNMTNYREEIFYLPSLPPEGNRIKTEKNPARISMNLAQEFIEEVIIAAKSKNGAALSELSQKKSLFVRNFQTNFNACRILGQKSEIEACQFLIKNSHDVYKTPQEVGKEAWSSFAQGAAYVGNTELAEQALAKIENLIDAVYINVAKYAAQGNQQDIAKYFLNKITDKSKCDYNIVAACAAFGSHQELAEYFLTQISVEQINYNSIAAYAAAGGHFDVANHFLNKIANKSQCDYNKVASFAAKRGHQQIADEFLKKIADKSKDSYRLVAQNAAFGGNQAVAEYFLEQIPNENDRNYHLVVYMAAAGDYPEIANHFLTKVRGFIDYSALAIQAAKDNHFNVVDYFLNKLSLNVVRPYAAITAIARNKNLPKIVEKYQNEFAAQMRIRAPAPVSSSTKATNPIIQMPRSFPTPNPVVRPSAPQPKGFLLRPPVSRSLSTPSNITSVVSSMSLAQEFIEKVVDAAKNKNLPALSKLSREKDPFLLNFQTNFNACHILGQKAEFYSCLLMAENHINTYKDHHEMRKEAWCSFAQGAAYIGNKDLAEQALAKIVNLSDEVYIDVAKYAAQGNQKKTAENFLNKIVDNSKHNYNIVAAFAAFGGHQELAEYFLKQISVEQINYNLIAAFAAAGGRLNIANHFLNKIADKSQCDYNKVASAAAGSGHQQIADEFLNKIENKNKSHYYPIAQKAAQGGYLAAAKHFFNQIPNINRLDYSTIISNAASSGYPEIADHFLSEFPNINYSVLITVAANENRFRAVDYFLNKLSSDERPYAAIIDIAKNKNLTKVAEKYQNELNEQIKNTQAPTAVSTPVSSSAKATNPTIRTPSNITPVVSSSNSTPLTANPTPAVSSSNSTSSTAVASDENELQKLKETLLKFQENNDSLKRENDNLKRKLGLAEEEKNLYKTEVTLKKSKIQHLKDKLQFVKKKSEFNEDNDAQPTGLETQSNTEGSSKGKKMAK